MIEQKPQQLPVPILQTPKDTIKNNAPPGPIRLLPPESSVFVICKF